MPTTGHVGRVLSGAAVAVVGTAAVRNLVLEVAGAAGAGGGLGNLLRRPGVVLAGVMVIAAGLALLVCVVGRVWICCAAATMVTMLAAAANYEKMAVRQEPLYPSDLFFLGHPRLLLDMVGEQSVLLARGVARRPGSHLRAARPGDRAALPPGCPASRSARVVAAAGHACLRGDHVRRRAGRGRGVQRPGQPGPRRLREARRHVAQLAAGGQLPAQRLRGRVPLQHRPPGAGTAGYKPDPDARDHRQVPARRPAPQRRPVACGAVRRQRGPDPQRVVQRPDPRVRRPLRRGPAAVHPAAHGAHPVRADVHTGVRPVAAPPTPSSRP